MRVRVFPAFGKWNWQITVISKDTFTLPLYVYRIPLIIGQKTISVTKVVHYGYSQKLTSHGAPLPQPYLFQNDIWLVPHLILGDSQARPLFDVA